MRKAIALFILCCSLTALQAQDATQWKEKEITLRVSNQPLGKVLEMAAEAAGAKITLQGVSLWNIDKHTSIAVKNKPLDKVLNDLIGDAVRLQEPPSYQGRRMRVFFSSQVGVRPPLFVLHVNDEGLLHFSYQRYLENTIRNAYDFSGTPIKVVVREKKDED